MQKNKTIVFSQDLNAACAASKKIEKNLLDKGLFDFSFFICNNFEECLKACENAKQECDTTLVVCENEVIDEILSHIKSEELQFLLVNQQAVKVESKTTYRKMLFVPIEIAVENFLDEIVSKKDVFAYSLFGKTRGAILDVLNKMKSMENFDFGVLSESEFLHIIYTSKEVKDGLLQNFGESLFACKKSILEKECASLLQEKGLKLALVEEISVGGVAKRLLMQENLRKDAIVENLTLASEKSFEKVGLDEAFINEKGTASKETAFEMAKNLLQKSGADIAIAVCGFDCDAGKCFVAVGNSEKICLNSSIFYGDKNMRLENLSNFALLKLLCFLKENSEKVV